MRTESLEAIAARKKDLGPPRLRSLALGRLRRIVPDWGAEDTAAMLATLDPPTKQGPGATREGDGELVEAAVRHAAFNNHGPAAVMVVGDVFQIDDAEAHDLFRRFRIDPETGEEVSR